MPHMPDEASIHLPPHEDVLRRPTDERAREHRSLAGREAGREADRELARSFADPNAADDARLGKSFEETESSRPKPPLKDRVHLPHAPGNPRSRRVFWIVLLVALAVFAVVLLAGWLPRHNTNKHNEEQAEQRRNAKPVVEVAEVKRSKARAGLVVPGTTLPLTEAYIYARANGYLKKRLADIGDHVHKGQLLAVIEAPDLDAQAAQAVQQLRQSQQQLDQQKAQLALATVTVNRYRVLVAKGVFSRQDGDTQETNYGSQLALVSAAQRNVDAFQANLRRVEALQSYEFVRAPFDGVITQRNVDVGALISASGTSAGESSGPAPVSQTSTTGGTTQASQANVGGTSGSTSSAATPAQSPGQGGPLFGLAQNERLRILVSVPEGYIGAIHVGAAAQLSFQEFGDQTFPGKVTRTANSVDPNTRTMLTEVQVDNRNGKLVPGMYVVTTFAPAPGLQAPLLITGDAIAIRNDRTTVAKVVDGKIHLVPVVLGRDFGTAVEIVSGVNEGDLIVTNITDDVREGAPVRTAMEHSREEQPSAAPANTPPGGSSQYGNPGITDRNLQGQQGQQNGQGAHGAASGKGSPSSSSESKP